MLPAYPARLEQASVLSVTVERPFGHRRGAVRSATDFFPTVNPTIDFTISLRAMKSRLFIHTDNEWNLRTAEQLSAD